jgi:hypothetical protein
MTDEEFVHAFFASLPDGFHHRDHLRLAWLVLERKGSVDAALPLIEHAIQGFARAHGAERKYHRTLTEFWVRLVEHCRSARPGIRSFDDFLDAFPLLLEPGLAERHWSGGELWSETARAGWVEPDLLPLP